MDTKPEYVIRQRLELDVPILTSETGLLWMNPDVPLERWFERDYVYIGENVRALFDINNGAIITHWGVIQAESNFETMTLEVYVETPAYPVQGGLYKMNCAYRHHLDVFSRETNFTLIEGTFVKFIGPAKSGDPSEVRVRTVDEPFEVEFDISLERLLPAGKLNWSKEDDPNNMSSEKQAEQVDQNE